MKFTVVDTYKKLAGLEYSGNYIRRHKASVRLIEIGFYLCI
jgi:hypothetical protein